MGKRAALADPLRVQASRVEKPGRVQRHTRTLPSWFYRVHSISFTENREVYAGDFDEDLSELEDQTRDDVGQSKWDYKCGGEDPECDCYHESDDMDDDGESERSYDGSDADYYYELKEDREERKQQKLQERKRRERERDIEVAKEEEVRTAYRSLKKDEKESGSIAVESLAGQTFKLFCSDHVDYFYSDLYATKRVDFYRLDNMDGGMGNDTDTSRLDKNSPSGEAEMLYGDVYLNASATCDFGPFRPPKHASQETLKVKSCCGKYELSFKFIGNGYLKLRVSREMVFMQPYSPSAPAPLLTAPEMFEFVGVWHDREKEKAERQKRMEARRSPSPRETWFEMNHPMGWWHQSQFP
ncbi:hypothetical protein B0O99DRAFT_655799 [Bisporella sp. PMI_857]|nr:hypothetical protein B0O99DRAFT_655799 [Bisporella sp. PMI_857]